MRAKGPPVNLYDDMEVSAGSEGAASSVQIDQRCQAACVGAPCHTGVNRSKCMKFSVASANVNTLLDDRFGHDNVLAGRVQMLEMQFDRAELDVVAVQEAR